MSDTNKNQLSEEELKELQRKEAMSSSDEYDIQDETYENYPITRQYVKEDIIVNGPELVLDEDDEDDVLVINNNKKQDNVSVPQTQTNKQKTETVEQKVSLINESDREYIDREDTIHGTELNIDSQLQKNNKEETKDRDTQKKWSSFIAIITVAITIVLALIIYVTVVGYQTSNQKLTDEANDYLLLIENTNIIAEKENELCKRYKDSSEKFVIDIINKEQYIAELQLISKDIDAAIQDYVSHTYKIDANSVMSITIQYLKDMQIDIRTIISLDPNTSVGEVKKIVLKQMDPYLSDRNITFNSMLELLKRIGLEYNIETEVKDNVIYTNISTD